MRGVPSCRGAFTPSARLVSIRRVFEAIRTALTETLRAGGREGKEISARRGRERGRGHRSEGGRRRQGGGPIGGERRGRGQGRADAVLRRCGIGAVPEAEAQDSPRYLRIRDQGLERHPFSEDTAPRGEGVRADMWAARRRGPRGRVSVLHIERVAERPVASR